MLTFIFTALLALISAAVLGAVIHAYFTNEE